MVKHIVKFLATYGYNSPTELFQSMFPTCKYQLQYLSLIISAVSALLSYMFGFGPQLGLAMLVAIIVEIYTGIKASRKQGNSFESFKFSRCILKLALWALIFYIIHAFENEYINRTHVFDLLAHAFFKFVFLGAITLFFVEHVTSILENMAVMDGKPKDYLIGTIQDTWKSVLESLKNKIS